MTAKEANFTIRFNGDTGALVQDLQKLKGVVENLDLSKAVKNSFNNIFSSLEKSLGKVGDGFANGLKSNKDITNFEQNLTRVGELLTKLRENLNDIPQDVIERSFTADPQVIKNLTDQVTELKNKIKDEASVAFENLKEKLEALKKETKANALGDLINSLKTGNIDEASKAFNKLQNYFGLVNKNSEKYKVWAAAIDAIGKEFEKLLPSVAKTNAEISELDKQMDTANQAAGKEGVQAWDGCKQSINGANDALQKTGQSFVETSKEANSLQKELDGFKNKVAYFFGLNNAVRLFQRALHSALETVKDLDKVMTETAVVTEFSVGDMWTQLPEYTKRANELGVSIHDVYEASTLYYQQGLKTNEVMAVTNATLKMARIAGLEASDATDRMTNALRGFNMEITEANANNIADVYSKLAAITASNVDEISTAMTKTASLAASANMSFENTAAFLAQIIETTRESAETAGTALKTVIARFSEVKKLYSEGELLGTDAEGEAIDINKVSTALRTAGIDMNEFLTGAKGLDEVFIELASKWNSLTLVQQRYIATMAAGSRQQSRFIALMSDYQRTLQLTGAANNAAGASTKQYEKTLESFQNKVARLKNAYNEFVLGIANSSVIKGAIDLLTGILTTLNKLTEGATKTGTSFKKLMLSIGLFSGAKAVLKGFEKNILGSIAQAFGKEGQNAGKSFLDGLKDSLGKARAVFSKDFWLGGIGDVGLTKTTIDYTQKLTEALNSQNKAATALGMTKKNIQLLEQAGIPLQQQAVLLQDANAASHMKNSAALDEETIAELRKIQAQKLETGEIQKGIVLKIAEKAHRLINVIGINTEKSALYQFILAKVKENEVLTENIALQMASMWYLAAILAIIVAIVATLALLTVAIVKTAKATSDKAKLEQLKENLEQINEELTNTRDKLDSLEEKTNKLKELNDGFKDLTKGTIEWRQQLVEANQAVLDLVEENPELAPFLQIGEFGQLTIETSALENLIKTQTDHIIDLQKQTLETNIKQQTLETRASVNDIFKAAGLSKAGTETDFWDSPLGIGILNLVLPGGVIAGFVKGAQGNGSYRRAQERAQYGGLTYKEFAQVVNTIAGKIDVTNGIQKEEKEFIGDILNSFNLGQHLDSFMEVLEELGPNFERVVVALQTEMSSKLNEVISLISGEESLEGYTEFLTHIPETIIKAQEEAVAQAENTFLKNLSKEALEYLGITKTTQTTSSGQEISTYYYTKANGQPVVFTDDMNAGKLTDPDMIQKYKEFLMLGLEEQFVSMYEQFDEIDKGLFGGTGVNVSDILGLEGAYRPDWLDSLELADQLDIQEFLADAISKIKIDAGLIGPLSKQLNSNVAHLLAEAFRSRNVLNPTEQGNLIKKFLDAQGLTDDQYNEAVTYLASGNFEAFKEYLIKLNKQIPLTQLEQFRVQLGLLDKQFSTNTIVQLNNRFKELEGTMTKLAEGTREFNEEEYQQLIANGLNANDFISTGEDKYRYTGDTETAATILATNLFQEAASTLQTMETSQHAVAGVGMVGYTEEEIAPVRERVRKSSQQYGYLGVEVSGDQGVDLEAYDEGLIERIKEDYPQLIGLVDELTKAQEKEEKAGARAAARLAIANEKARASFNNLTSAVQDNLEVLKKEYRGTDEYAEALENITQYAKEAFSQDVTSDFIDQNLDLFIDFANGVEGSTRKIQDALLDTVTDTGLNVDVIRAAIESLDQTGFDIYGQADFGPIFEALDKVATDSEELAAYLTTLEGLGFKIEYTYDKDGNINGGKIVNIGEQQRQRNFRSYGGGASKSSGGSSSKAWENPYDELYNLTQKINTQLREREKLEKDYDRLLQRRSESVEEIKQKSLDILAALYRERDLNQQLLEGRRQQAAKILNQAYLDDDGTFKTFGQMGMAKYGSIDVDTGEVQINYDLIDSVTDAIEGARISAYISALEEAGKNIQDTTDEIEELDDKIYEEQQRGKQDYLELEERTYQALVNQQQKIIDGYKTLSDAITDANQQIISSLRESVEMERQIRDNTKKEEDIADKEARLAYLRRDTSGANDTEIMKLEKELGEAREQYADSLVDQAIADLEDQNEKASEQRQKQIDLMQSQLDYWSANGHYWKDVHDLISTGTTADGLFNYSSKLAELLKGDDNFAGMSVFGQEDWMQSMAEQYSKAMVGEMYWQKIDLDTGGDAGKKLGQIAEASKRIGTSTGGTGDSSPGTPPPEAPPAPETPRAWNDLSRDEKFAAIRNMTYSDKVDIAELLGYDNYRDLERELTNPIVFTKIFKLLNEGKYKLSKFASGGLVTSTGPAWLDGSLSSPEMVLNAKDTANLIQLKSILAQILSGGTIPGGGGDNYYNIDINVDELASDYDVDKIAARIKQKIYDDSVYRNVNAINYIR